MSDESWHVVRNITGVTGFVGSGSRPVPLTEQEVEAFNVEVRHEDFTFKPGDNVRIVSGVFAGYSGTVDSVSDDKKQVTVMASTGRRAIPIQVDAKDICLSED